MIKTKVAFLEAGFYPANQSHLKSFQKALIGWLKADPPKKPLLFDYVNRLIVLFSFNRLLEELNFRNFSSVCNYLEFYP